MPICGWPTRHCDAGSSSGPERASTGRPTRRRWRCSRRLLNVNYICRRRRLDLPIWWKLRGWVSTRLRVCRDAASSGISGGGVGTLDLQIQEIAEEDWLLAVGAGTPEAKHAAEAV